MCVRLSPRYFGLPNLVGCVHGHVSLDSVRRLTLSLNDAETLHLRSRQGSTFGRQLL